MTLSSREGGEYWDGLGVGDVQSRFPGRQTTIKHARVCVTERAEYRVSSGRGEYSIGVIPGTEVSSNVSPAPMGLELQDYREIPEIPDRSWMQQSVSVIVESKIMHCRNKSLSRVPTT